MSGPKPFQNQMREHFTQAQWVDQTGDDEGIITLEGKSQNPKCIPEAILRGICKSYIFFLLQETPSFQHCLDTHEQQ